MRTIVAMLLLLGAPALAGDLTVPVEVAGARHAILVKVKVNGRDRTFMVDTGATRTVVDARAIGLAEIELKLSRFRTTGPGLSGEAVDAEVATLRLGDRTWEGRPVVVMNLDGLAPIYGRRIDGLLGQDILREFDRVAFDFKGLRMILSR